METLFVIAIGVFILWLIWQVIKSEKQRMHNATITDETISKYRGETDMERFIKSMELSKEINKYR